MKKILLISAACVLAGLVALAGSPVYVTKTAAGTASTPAFIIFPGDSSTQLRFVNVSYLTDTNNAAVTFTPCTGAYAISFATNAGALITVSKTNGLTAGASLIIQTRAGVTTNVVISSFVNATNVVLTCVTAATAINDEVFLLGTAQTYFVGIGTNALNGEAIFVGNQGRPVTVKLSPALVTNYLAGVTAHYD